MKYVITAKNIKDGTEHVTDPLKRTEICTELIMTRLKAIELLNTGKISRHDTIVTRIDRKCLYENIFDHVIDWADFERITAASDVVFADDVVDLVADINPNYAKPLRINIYFSVFCGFVLSYLPKII